MRRGARCGAELKRSPRRSGIKASTAKSCTKPTQKHGEEGDQVRRGAREQPTTVRNKGFCSLRLPQTHTGARGGGGNQVRAELERSLRRCGIKASEAKTSNPNRSKETGWGAGAVWGLCGARWSDAI